MIKEFKEFILRGNVMALAIAVIIGSAFSNIVTSLTNNIINPLLGLFVGKVDLSFLQLKVGPAVFKVGSFINSIINFLIIALIVFLIMKAINKIAGPVDKKEETISAEEKYLKDIRDILEEENKNKKLTTSNINKKYKNEW